MSRPLSGLRAWMVQRLSALYLLGFLVFMLATLTTAHAPWSYASWRAWVVSPGVSTGILLFFAALLLHVWVGLRDVIIDYIHPSALRIGGLYCLAMGELAIAAWVLVIVVQSG
jgi:succinate dehydrogenase / fumarate reductase membrane anchor subunit